MITSLVLSSLRVLPLHLGAPDHPLSAAVCSGMPGHSHTQADADAHSGPFWPPESKTPPRSTHQALLQLPWQSSSHSFSRFMLDPVLLLTPLMPWCQCWCHHHGSPPQPYLQRYPHQEQPDSQRPQASPSPRLCWCRYGMSLACCAVLSILRVLVKGCASEDPGERTCLSCPRRAMESIKGPAGPTQHQLLWRFQGGTQDLAL